MKNLPFLLLLLLPLSCWGQTDQTEEIRPPFGLNWGESPENTRKWIQKNQHKSVEGTAKDGRQVIEVEGPFPEVTFTRIRFHFSKNQLSEVELQFNQIKNKETNEEEAKTYTDALDIKSLIDSIHGKGNLVKNEKGEEPNHQWKYIHQIWTDEEHSIWLVVFHSKRIDPNPKNTFSLAMISLHYRWEKKLMENKKLEKK